ncbi:MAG: hypothetical protein ACO3I0_13060, partial [Limisphaerales bacterium]
MKSLPLFRMSCVLSALLLPVLSAADLAPEVLPGTRPLTQTGDLAHALVGGIDRYLDRVLEAAPEARARHWHRDLGSPEAYVRSIETNRQQLARILGVVEAITQSMFSRHASWVFCSRKK